MIVSQFLLWARRAPPGQRAEAVGALARAFLYSDLSARDRWEAETALTAMLDDPAPAVRRTLAETLAAAAEAPRHIVLALAQEPGEIGATVLARSPVLGDPDLVDLVALGDERAQAAVASRPWLSPALSAALAEIAGPAALATLGRNSGAEIAEMSLFRIVERHGEDGAVREALLGREDLPIPVRQAVAAALAASLDSFVVGCGWLSSARAMRVAGEARERAAVTLSAAAASSDDVARLVAHLRRSGQLTPALLLRAILSGADGLAEAAFADLSGLSPRRAAAILAEPGAAPFRALYERAGLPARLRPAFAAALAARGEGDGAGRAELSRRMVERALTACAGCPEDEAGRLVALLRRFEAEAAREEARRHADGLADGAALALVLAHAPNELWPEPGIGTSLAA